MKIECGCHCIKCGNCIKCGGMELESDRVGEVENDGYFDMHHTCKQCNTHFDHLEGQTFDSCEKCQYKIS